MSAILPQATAADRVSPRRSKTGRRPRGGCAAPRRSPPAGGDVGDLAPGDGGGPGVAEALVDRQLHLAADPQRLVVVPPLVGDVGDLAPGDGGGPGVAEALVDRQLHLAADPQRLVVVPPPVGDVGDLAPGDGGGPGVAEPLVDRQLDLAADAQCLVVVPPPVGDVGDLAPGDGGGPGVAEAFVDRQLHLAADPQCFVVVAPLVGDVGDRSHCRRGFPLRSCGGEQLAGVLEELFGLFEFAAGDEMAGLLEDDPGPVERAGCLLVPGLHLLGCPVQQCLTGLAVAAGEGRIGGPPQQFEWHGAVVPVEQPDRVLAETECIGGRAGAQRGDSAGGAGGGDGRVVGEQGELGQLQIQRPVTAGLWRGPAPGGEQRPGADRGQGGLLAGAERLDAPGGQRVGGQRQAGRVLQVRVGVQQPQAAQPVRRPPHLTGEHSDHRFGHRQVEQRGRPQQGDVRGPGLLQQGIEGQVFQERPHLGIGGQVALRQVGFHARDRRLGPVQADLLPVDQPQPDQVLQARVAPADRQRPRRPARPARPGAPRG